MRTALLGRGRHPGGTEARHNWWEQGERGSLCDRSAGSLPWGFVHYEQELAWLLEPGKARLCHFPARQARLPFFPDRKAEAHRGKGTCPGPTVSRGEIREGSGALLSPTWWVLWVIKSADFSQPHLI